MSKPKPIGRAATGPATIRFSLGQQVAKEINGHLHGAIRALQDAQEKARQLESRPTFASIRQELALIEKEVASIRGALEQIRKGKP